MRKDAISGLGLVIWSEAVDESACSVSRCVRRVATASISHLSKRRGRAVEGVWISVILANRRLNASSSLLSASLRSLFKLHKMLPHGTKLSGWI